MRMIPVARIWRFRTWCGRALALLVLGVLPALGAIGCRQSPTDSRDQSMPPSQEYVDWAIQDAALREWSRFQSYWNYRAAELRPFDGAERIVFGDVTEVRWTNKIRNTERLLHMLNTGKVEFRMVAQVAVIRCWPSNWRERLRLKYSLTDGTGG